VSQERSDSDRARERQAEELRSELLSQPLDADGVREAWKSSPFRDETGSDLELEELLALRTRLERSGRDAREVLARAAGSAGSPGEEAVAAFLERRLRPASEPARARARRFELVALVAALAAVVLAVLWVRGQRPASETPALLGEKDEVVLLQPVGSVTAWDAFRWRARRPDECWFELTVRAEDGRELGRATDLEGEEWLPPDSAGWPERVRWELVAHDADGRVGSWTAEAWRR